MVFSCSITNKQQPSLKLFVDGIENDIDKGLNLNCDKNVTDLSYLAKQGVLLMNSSLTVAKDKPGSHGEMWQEFTRFILEECLAYTGVPIIFIGKDAQFYERYTTPLTHGYTFMIEHPAFAARENRAWDTQDTFKKVNTILWQNNKDIIYWLNELPF